MKFRSIISLAAAASVVVLAAVSTSCCCAPLDPVCGLPPVYAAPAVCAPVYAPLPVSHVSVGYSHFGGSGCGGGYGGW